MFKRILLAAALLCAFAAPLAEGTQLLVPAYWGAYGSNSCSSKGITGLWKKMVQGAGSVTAIINPNSGPDYTGDDATNLCLPFLKAAGVDSIGYVATGYGERSLDDIYADIVQYKERYNGLIGIFLDEGTSWWDTDSSMVTFYTQITSFIRNQGFEFIVINAGTRVAPEFFQMADVVVGFEARNSQWFSGNNQGICPTPKGASKGDAGYCKGSMYCKNGESSNCRDRGTSELAALVFCTSQFPSTRWSNTLTQVRAAGYQYAYITNDGCGTTNPWNSLPPYWDSLWSTA